MSTPADAGDDTPGDRTESRAELLPEEAALDIQDARALAAEVLLESDERTADPHAGESGTADSPTG